MLHLSVLSTNLMLSKLTGLTDVIITAGSFMAGSIRWIRISDHDVRFDIVTYWTRSFSVFNNPNRGQQVHITAQSTVQFDPGDGATQYLVANITKVSIEEDWFEAVTVVYHTYSQVTAFLNFRVLRLCLNCEREQPYQSSILVPDYSPTANSSDGIQVLHFSTACIQRTSGPRSSYASVWLVLRLTVVPLHLRSSPSP